MPQVPSGRLREVGPRGSLPAFRHEAFLYAGTGAFLGGTLPFIEAGLVAGEPVLVVVEAEKVERLREQLGADTRRVAFADMAAIGRNPARIIPAWRDFLAVQPTGGQPPRGIGEPVYAERTPEELVECQRHEALLNVAFAGGAPWRLLCPYDTSLGPDVLREAGHSHRYLVGDTDVAPSPDYRGNGWTGPGDDDLGEPPGEAAVLAFGLGPLDPVRQFVADTAGPVLDATELIDLLLAVTEVASNSLVHGGGSGTLSIWSTPRAMVCEVRDHGWIREPLVGRARPGVDREHGRGLWMVNQLCDLVQLRSSPQGTVVRMHMQPRTSPVLSS